jgi:Glycoside Hydrolase Family 113
MNKALGYTTAGVFLLALVGALIADHTTADVSVGKTSGGVDIEQRPAQLIGAALNLYHTDRLELYHEALEQMSSAGFNAVQIVTPIFQDDGAAGVVEMRQGPGRGPAMADIASLLSHAKRLGMKTMLMPQINFTQPRGNEWRGKLQPEHWAPWWESYTRTIGLFLETAVENDVDVFVVGCELLTTHKPQHEERWRELIAHCREKFTGQLTYSTTWDTYHKVGFWDALDVVGVSGYWDITTLAQDSDNPTPDELKRRWIEIQRRLLAYADAQGRPVLLTEVGYPSLPWALKSPWNYINNDGVTADHEAQRQGYTAFIAAWDGTIAPRRASTADEVAGGDPRSIGVFFHKWDPYHQGGPDDTGYGVAGKPAYQVLADWLQGAGPSAASMPR